MQVCLKIAAAVFTSYKHIFLLFTR